MNMVKIKTSNKREDNFPRDYLVVYIEKEIAERFSTGIIIDQLYN